MGIDIYVVIYYLLTKEVIMTDKAVINIDIPQELYDKAKEEAKRLGIPLAGFVRQLMVQYFEKKA